MWPARRGRHESAAAHCWRSRRRSRTRWHAARLLFTFLEPFACTNRKGQSVFCRRVGAFVARVVIAVRVIGEIEVELVHASPAPVEIDVAARGIRFGAARAVAERHE